MIVCALQHKHKHWTQSRHLVESLKLNRMSNSQQAVTGGLECKCVQIKDWKKLARCTKKYTNSNPNCRDEKRTKSKSEERKHTNIWQDRIGRRMVEIIRDGFIATAYW